MKKHFFFHILILVFCSILFAFSVYAASEEGFMGISGDANWRAEFISGNFYISGDGKMLDYTKDKLPKWCSFPKKLKTVTIKDGLQNIGNYAFYTCTGIRSVTISDSVTSIGDYAFYGCKYLETIYIPKSVTSIGVNAFGECTKLSVITVDPENTTFSSINNVLYNNKTNSLVKYAPAKTDTSYTIPKDIKKIEPYAFAYNPYITSVTMPNSITSMGEFVFSNCERLQEVSLPSRLKTIPAHTFSFCKNLTSVSMPKDLDSIGDAAFHHCYQLPSIQIPDSVETIGNSAFSSCSRLVLDKLPENLKSLGDLAFASCDLLALTEFPTSLEEIGRSAFYECTSLREISVGPALKKIGKNVFSYCPKAVFYCQPGSVFEAYAKEYYLTYKTTPAPKPVLGDLNEDDIVNFADARIAFRSLAANEFDAIADMNQDGKKTLLDALLITKEAKLIQDALMAAKKENS